jgi:hypothetical protein
VPFFRIFGNKVTLDAQDRGHLGWVWGASEITYLSANKRQCYKVTHSKWKMLRQSLRFTKNALRFLVGYGALHAAWTKGYDTLTSEPYWRAKLAMQEGDDKS